MKPFLKPIFCFSFILSWGLLSSCRAPVGGRFEIQSDEANREQVSFAIPIRDIGKKIDSYMEEFKASCLSTELGAAIETRRLPDTRESGGSITRYGDGEGNLLRYQLKVFGNAGVSISNYYFLDEFTYVTYVNNSFKEYESRIEKPLSEGILTQGNCYRYSREKDEILESEAMDSVYSQEELEQLFQEAQKTQYVWGELESGEKALNAYQEFLAGQEMPSLTATEGYPRGDSGAVYAIGDCNGDKMPELHIDGGNTYRIYTYRGDELVLLKAFSHDFIPVLTPLEDGRLVGCGRELSNKEYLLSTCAAIPAMSQELPFENGIDRFTDFYMCLKLDADGNFITEESSYYSADFSRNSEEAPDYRKNYNPVTKEEWERQVNACKSMLEDETLHLTWEYVFPREKWDYLNALEEGAGPLAIEEEGEEWQAYQCILSGDFSSIGDLDDRSRLIAEYKTSLDQDSGRSKWRYTLKDINGDGIKEMFVQYYPDRDSDFQYEDYFLSVPGIIKTSDNLACFSYQNGKVKLLWSDATGAHTYTVPLTDGRLIEVDDYAYIPAIWIIKLKSDFQRESSEEYVNLIVDYEAWNESVYQGILEDYGVSGEGCYYFYINNGITELSEEQWNEMEQMISSLLIPDSQWLPASVFMPNRRLERFSWG